MKREDWNENFRVLEEKCGGLRKWKLEVSDPCMSWGSNGLGSGVPGLQKEGEPRTRYPDARDGLESRFVAKEGTGKLNLVFLFKKFYLFICVCSDVYPHARRGFQSLL